MKKKIFTLLIISACIINVEGCSSDNTRVGNSVSDDGYVEVFDYDEYSSKILDESILDIGEIYSNYEEISKEIEKNVYDNIDFSDAVFIGISDFDSVYVLRGSAHGISLEDSIDTIEEWLDEIGFSDDIDLNTELYVVTDKIDIDESKEYPDWYPLVYEHLNLDTGAGVFLDTTDCHIQMSDNGIYSMNDGKIERFLGIIDFTHKGALGEYVQDIVMEGSVENLSEESYPMIAGTMTVAEGAELVKEYFEKGTPFKPQTGVSVLVPYVKIFRIGDVYGYDYTLQRSYKGIPISIAENGIIYQSNTDNVIYQDTKHATVVDNEGVSAFCGYNEAEKIDELYSSKKMLNIDTAVDLVEEKLATNVNFKVEKVTLEYLTLRSDLSEATADEVANSRDILYPCWSFYGTNLTTGQEMYVYIDVLTGELYYMTIIDED